MTKETQNADPNAATPPQPSSEPQPGAASNEPAPQGVNPSSQAPEPVAPRGLKGSGLRYGDADSVPDWAKGRTADEILNIASTLYDTIQRGQTSPPAPTPAAPMTPAPNGDGLPQVNHNLIYTDPVEYHRQMEARQEARIQAALQAATPSVVTPLAGMAKQMARAHRPDIWSTYGPDIEATMAALPEQSKADVETWKRVVDYVAGQHVDEIARRKAEELMRQGHDTGMLSGGGGPPAPGTSSMSPVKKLFADNHPAIRSFKEADLTADDVIKHGAKMGHDEGKWAEMLTRKVKAHVPA